MTINGRRFVRRLRVLVGRDLVECVRRVIADGRIQRGRLHGCPAQPGNSFDLQAKYRQIEKNEIRCEQSDVDDADIVIVAYGICARIARRAAQQAREQGIKVGCIRPITLWPFPSESISKAADKSPIFLVVEMSCGQMVEDVRLAVAGKSPVVFWGRPGGGIVTVEKVLEKIEQLIKKAKK